MRWRKYFFILISCFFLFSFKTWAISDQSTLAIQAPGKPITVGGSFPLHMEIQSGRSCFYAPQSILLQVIQNGSTTKIVREKKIPDQDTLQGGEKYTYDIILRAPEETGEFNYKVCIKQGDSILDEKYFTLQTTTIYRSDFNFSYFSNHPSVLEDWEMHHRFGNAEGSYFKSVKEGKGGVLSNGRSRKSSNRYLISRKIPSTFEDIWGVFGGWMKWSAGGTVRLMIYQYDNQNRLLSIDTKLLNLHSKEWSWQAIPAEIRYKTSWLKAGMSIGSEAKEEAKLEIEEVKLLTLNTDPHLVISPKIIRHPSYLNFLNELEHEMELAQRSCSFDQPIQHLTNFFFKENKLRYPLQNDGDDDAKVARIDKYGIRLTNGSFVDFARPYILSNFIPLSRENEESYTFRLNLDSKHEGGCFIVLEYSNLEKSISKITEFYFNNKQFIEARGEGIRFCPQFNTKWLRLKISNAPGRAATLIINNFTMQRD